MMIISTPEKVLLGPIECHGSRGNSWLIVLGRKSPRAGAKPGWIYEGLFFTLKHYCDKRCWKISAWYLTYPVGVWSSCVKAIVKAAMRVDVEETLKCTLVAPISCSEKWSQIQFVCDGSRGRHLEMTRSYRRLSLEWTLRNEQKIINKYSCCEF